MTNDDERAFAALLTSVRERVDERLSAWLRPKTERAQSIGREAGAAAAALQDLTLRGGKRLRAGLVALGYASCAGSLDLDACEPAILAVELLQTYLLIHDDWMDDDDVRRGAPSVHVTLRGVLGGPALGDAAAILAGDLASSYAQEALLESTRPPQHVLAAARAFARMQEDVVVGQLAEITAPAPSTGAKGPDVEIIHELKTASYTVIGPLLVGASLAGGGEPRLSELRGYGRALGIAFQLRDDVLGVFGQPERTGKPVGNDIRQGKRTSLALDSLARPGAEGPLARAFGVKSASDAEVRAAARFMEECGARARVEARIGGLLHEARALLSGMSALPPHAQRCLAGAIATLGERAS